MKDNALEQNNAMYAASRILRGKLHFSDSHVLTFAAKYLPRQLNVGRRYPYKTIPISYMGL